MGQNAKTVDDDDAEPLGRRQSQVTQPAPEHPSPQEDSSPASSEGTLLAKSRRGAGTSSARRGSVTKGRRPSTRLATASSQPSQQPTPPSPRGQSSYNFAPRLLPRPPFQQHPASLSDESPQSPTDRFIVQDEPLQPLHPPLVLSAEDRAAHPNVYTEKSVFPLQDKRQALLLRHFVQNLAIWLDLCEPSHQFGTIVPQRAATCTVLLNAILALSSKHLAHLGNFDRYASDHYHQECLNVLIPMLSHEDTAADENLFAATIILRVWEEMEFKHTGFDSQGYLLGIHAFVHGHGHKIAPNTLSAAAFWVGLRQEIYTATVNQQPVKAPLQLSLADGARGLGPAEDHDWANRAVIHCVDVLNFCFGDNTSSSSPRFSWDALSVWNKQWTALLPDSFTPTLFREREAGESFPEIWHHSSWHVTGIQHHILAQLFLVSFDPKIPRIGRQRLEAAKKINSRVCELVREICGIGLSNQWTPPAMFTACMAITAFGDRFHERADQEALLDMLRLTEKDHARPTEAVQQQLMRSWNWTSEQMT
ncbi:hypothetical protein SEUCBS139899_004092 [Sporothrix eucalyptigena]